MRCDRDIGGGLVLTRSETEAIVVDTEDGPICVYVKSIQGDRVRLGVIAPSGMPVMRGELQRLDGSRFDAVFRR